MESSTYEIFETNNFALETFIHVHDIRYENSYMDEFGISLGVITAIKQYSGLDYITLAAAMLFSSMPAFWFGLMAQIYFCLNLHWLPATGADTWVHFILPSFTTSIAFFASGSIFTNHCGESIGSTALPQR